MDKGDSWLLLSLQLPSGPAYPRVKLWRRLREAGAISIHGGMHALPDRRAHRALLERLAAEVREQGGQALLFYATVRDTDQSAFRAQFDAARSAEFGQWLHDAGEMLSGRPKTSDVSRMRRRLERIHATDFFQACDRSLGRAKLDEIVAASKRHPDVSAHRPLTSFRAPQLHGRTWVTRKDIGVDRIASAWLIARFIDPRPRFRFVDPDRHVHQPRELRFDMADGEFTHEGDRCSFETLLARADIAPDPGLVRLAEVIHRLDVDDGKFERVEARALAAQLDAICEQSKLDLERLDRAGPVLDELHRQLAAR